MFDCEIKEAILVLVKSVVPDQSGAEVIIFSALVEPADPPAGASVTRLDTLPPKSIRA